MSTTENRLLKQCKLKFQNCYRLNNGAVNVPVFVEKFMQGIRIGKCSLRLLNQFSGQFLLLSVFAAGLGACIGLMRGETLGQVLPYYLMAFLSLYLHFSLTGLMDPKGRREALKTTLTDFLENRMAERIKQVEEDSRYLEEEEARAYGKRRERLYAGQKEEPVFSKAVQEPAPLRSERDAILSGEEQETELEALLQEFLA